MMFVFDIWRARSPVQLPLSPRVMKYTFTRGLGNKSRDSRINPVPKYNLDRSRARPKPTLPFLPRVNPREENSTARILTADR